LKDGIVIRESVGPVCLDSVQRKCSGVLPGYAACEEPRVCGGAGRAWLDLSCDKVATGDHGDRATSAKLKYAGSSRRPSTLECW
jgi:hypothetical protein